MTIAQEIRNAAINWPQFIGDVECDVAQAFDDVPYNRIHTYLTSAPDDGCWKGYEYQARIFMLLVAEALE